MRTSLTALCGLILYIATDCVHAADLTVGPEEDTACLFHDLQAAVDAVHANVATVRVSQDFVSPPISYSNKIVTILGGYQNCSSTALVQPPQTPSASIVGFLGNNGEKPLININGSAKLNLQNFLLELGHNNGGNGGGISFVSNGDHGHIELHNVLVLANGADKGGGIYFNGGSSADDLQLFNTNIVGNTANNAGGGIRLQGHVHMDMDAHSNVANNTANPNDGDSHGGGLQVLDGSVANINGRIEGNTAKFGAGIAMHDNAVLRLASGAGQLASVSNNTSPQDHTDGRGGGLWLSAFTKVCGVGYNIDGNKAPDGAAIYMDQTLPGGYTVLSKGDSPTDDTPFPCSNFGSVSDQSTINSNTATGANGSIVWVNHGSFVADSLEMTQNVASNLFMKTRTTDSSYFTLASCLLTQNFIGHVLVESHAPFRMDGCTVADNSIHDPQVMTLEDIVTISNSIVFQPGRPTMHAVGNGLEAVLKNILVSDVSIGSEATTNLVFDNVQNGDPLFVDPSTLNYNVQTSNSPIVDSYSGCGTSDGRADLQSNKFDRIGNLRGKVVNSGIKPCDMGAFEFQGDVAPPSDSIFPDGFDGNP